MDQHESQELEMPLIYTSFPIGAALSVLQFDHLLSQGWRFLGNSALCHSVSYHYDSLVFAIPGRIILPEFQFSKSQRKLLAKAKQRLTIQIEDKVVNTSDERLFALHTTRFDDNPPSELKQMVHYKTDLPVPGKTIRIFLDGEHVATSFFHIGHIAIDSSYCVYNPDKAYRQYSLGNLTLLLEIEYALALGMTYYYVGYRYSVPSHFDYKANFNALQRFHLFQTWVACPRIHPKPYESPLT
jgi:leucyl-tRNA---protein transferase